MPDNHRAIDSSIRTERTIRAAVGAPSTEPAARSAAARFPGVGIPHFRTGKLV